GHRLRAIAMRFEQPRELLGTGFIRARGEADEDGTAGDEHVAAVERRGLSESRELAVAGEHRNDGVRLSPPRRRSGASDDGELRHYHRDVLDEVRVGKTWERIEHLDLETQRAQRIRIRGVL